MEEEGVAVESDLEELRKAAEEELSYFSNIG